MQEITKKSEELFKIENQYLEFMKKPRMGTFPPILDLMINAVNLVEEIKLSLAQLDPDSIRIENENVRNILKNIREDKQLKCIEAYNTLIEHIRAKKQTKSELNEPGFAERNWDILFETYHSRFDINTYFYDKLRVGPIITNSTLPNALKDYFSELKEAYAYGLNKACVALCRMLLEISFSDCLKNETEYKNATIINRAAKDKPAFEFSLYENINIAQSLNLIPEDFARKAHTVRCSGNRVVHIEEKRTKNKPINTMEMIKDTIAIIEMLYR
jgi:hypothetical protein